MSTKKDKELKEIKANMQKEYEAIQQNRNEMVKGVLNELASRTINNEDAQRKLVLLMNVIEFQTAQSMLSINDEPVKN